MMIQNLLTEREKMLRFCVIIVERSFSTTPSFTAGNESALDVESLQVSVLEQAENRLALPNSLALENAIPLVAPSVQYLFYPPF